MSFLTFGRLYRAETRQKHKASPHLSNTTDRSFYSDNEHIIFIFLFAVRKRNFQWSKKTKKLEGKKRLLDFDTWYILMLHTKKKINRKKYLSYVQGF